MRVIEVRCQSCAAPLEIPPKVTNVTCTFCDTPLVVQREGGVAFTKALEEVQERIEAIAERQERMEKAARHRDRMRRAERLDRSWERGRERFMTRHKDGSRSIPTKAGGIAIGSVIALFSLALLSQAGPGSLLGVVFGIVLGWAHVARARSYQVAQARYRSTRRRIMRGERASELDAAQQGRLRRRRRRERRRRRRRRRR